MRQDKAATAPPPSRQGALTVSEYRWQDSWETRLEIRPWGVTRSKIPALGQVGDTGAFAREVPCLPLHVRILHYL